MISISNLTLQQGSFSLKQISFRVERGEYAVMMGKTGCGKTSILEAICGLRPIAAGEIQIEHQNVTSQPPALRGIGYVPQDGALFPTMTVEDQIGFALHVRRRPRQEIATRVAELSQLLEIPHLLKRLPGHLSGGEAQRVALGRALAFRPHVLLLDEPLSALDPNTREHMYQLLRRIRQQTQITAIHVTHSPIEAETLADVVLELKEGGVTKR